MFSTLAYWLGMPSSASISWWLDFPAKSTR